MTDLPYQRVFCLVLDSLGVGELPDASAYGDQGAHTLAHIAEAVPGLELPHLEQMGLGCIAGVRGLQTPANPTGAYGRMGEQSPAKDTTTGHWEMMGYPLSEPFPVFPAGFPKEIIDPFVERIGVDGVLANEPASGTEIIERLGEEHARCQWPIVYTSADSVFQIAAHEDVVGLETLYHWCEVARELLTPWRVSRVIARPFIGEPGAYQRTYNRRDYSLVPERTVLNVLEENGIPVLGVGKIEDIFAGSGVTRSIHTEGNRDGMAAVLGLASEVGRGMVFCNLVDFDMLYGHRRDPEGYARALCEFDLDLGALTGHLSDDDLVLLTADHGNDPTHSGTDHTREYVPVVMWNPAGRVRGDVGTRSSFADLGATVAEAFSVESDLPGRSMLAAAGGVN